VAYAPERCKDGKVVGIVTDRDVTCRTAARGLYPTQTTMVGILSQGRCGDARVAAESGTYARDGAPAAVGESLTRSG